MEAGGSHISHSEAASAALGRAGRQTLHEQEAKLLGSTGGRDMGVSAALSKRPRGEAQPLGELRGEQRGFTGESWVQATTMLPVKASVQGPAQCKA